MKILAGPLKAELSKIPDDYEIILMRVADIHDGPTKLVVSHKEKFVIIKYTSYALAGERMGEND